MAKSVKPFKVSVDRVTLLSRGVAYGVVAAEALKLRKALAERWDHLLGRQDRAWSGRLHVTVQNAVDPAAARALYDRLASSFEPETIEATGLAAWHYVGGPWRPAGKFHIAQRS